MDFERVALLIVQYLDRDRLRRRDAGRGGEQPLDDDFPRGFAHRPARMIEYESAEPVRAAVRQSQVEHDGLAERTASRGRAVRAIDLRRCAGGSARRPDGQPRAGGRRARLVVGPPSR